MQTSVVKQGVRWLFCFWSTVVLTLSDEHEAEEQSLLQHPPTILSTQGFPWSYPIYIFLWCYPTHGLPRSNSTLNLPRSYPTYGLPLSYSTYNLPRSSRPRVAVVRAGAQRSGDPCASPVRIPLWNVVAGVTKYFEPGGKLTRGSFFNVEYWTSGAFSLLKIETESRWKYTRGHFSTAL
jgi:hypothetical protein